MPRWRDNRLPETDALLDPYLHIPLVCITSFTADYWPRLDSKLGLEMQIVESSRADGTTLFSFSHSRAYQSVQKSFYDAVASHNPDQLTALVQHHPYHIDSLLQLSHISRASGNTTQAAELIERALYAFEKSFHPSFNISTSQRRLDFRRLEVYISFLF